MVLGSYSGDYDTQYNDYDDSHYGGGYEEEEYDHHAHHYDDYEDEYEEDYHGDHYDAHYDDHYGMDDYDMDYWKKWSYREGLIVLNLMYWSLNVA